MGTNMATTVSQICVLLSALCSLVYSQAPTNFGNPFGPGFPGSNQPQPLDPNFPPNFGLGGNDPNMFPNQFNPNFPPNFGGGQPGPMPLQRPSPFQSMLPLMMMRGGDMGPLLLMSMLGGAGGGGGFGGGFGSNPFLMMSLLNNM